MIAQPHKLQKKRVLIVEDEDYMRDLYKQILEEEGYEVTAAQDGEEGYNAMHAGGYDLVLLDIVLPKIDGLSILEKLKQGPVPIRSNKSVVILTNLDQDLTIAKGVAYGVRGYMMKSDYTPDKLLKELQQYL